METAKPSLIERFRSFFLREKSPFTAKADLNWPRIYKCFALAAFLGVALLLFLPSPKPEEKSFHEQADGGTSSPEGRDQDPTQETMREMDRGIAPATGRPVNNGGGGGAGVDRGASMILARGGEDAKTHIPPGGRIPVHLRERVAVTATAMPVIGIVARDYVQGDIVAIPAGSKLLGQVTFDANGDRAKVEWQSIEFESGQQHQFSAVGIGSDGQLGVQGNIQSNAAENIIGATLTRFIGAYAEGSMERGALGGNPGGSDNGWKNAVSETAKDQADAFAETLKKEKRWIELDPGMEFFAVLTSSFTFREVGATYGR